MTEAKVVALPVAVEEPALIPEENLTSYQQMQQQAKKIMEPFVMQLEAYELPDDKLEAIIDFATKTFAKYHRHMKEPRMLRKVVEQFKLKLKPKNDEQTN